MILCLRRGHDRSQLAFEIAEVEIIPPFGDQTIPDAKAAHERDRDQPAIGRAEFVDAFGEDCVSRGRERYHFPINLETRTHAELMCKGTNRFAAGHGFHRDIMIEDIFRQKVHARVDLPLVQQPDEALD